MGKRGETGFTFKTGEQLWSNHCSKFWKLSGVFWSFQWVCCAKINKISEYSHFQSEGVFEWMRSWPISASYISGTCRRSECCRRGFFNKRGVHRGAWSSSLTDYIDWIYLSLLKHRLSCYFAIMLWYQREINVLVCWSWPHMCHCPSKQLQPAKCMKKMIR